MNNEQNKKMLNISFRITSLNTYETYEKFLDFIKSSVFQTKQNALENALLIGMNEILNGQLEQKEPIHIHVENVASKYKNYLLKSIDLRVISLIKYHKINEKKMNLLINSLAEQNIIDTHLFLETESAMQLTEDQPWISQLKKDIDNDFDRININDFLEIKKE